MAETKCTNESATISVVGRLPVSRFASRIERQHRQRRTRRRQQQQQQPQQPMIDADRSNEQANELDDADREHEELLLRLRPAAKSESVAASSSPVSSGRQEQQAQAHTRLKLEVGGASKRSSLACLLALVVVFTLMLELITSNMAPVEGAKLPDIYWNASNPIFRRENLDHIFEVNKKQHDHDQVDLVCPQAQPSQQVSVDATGNQTNELHVQGPAQTTPERYIIYNVSKDEYDNCRLNGPSAQMVAKCDQAQASSRPPRPTTITFRSFTPQPNGLEFKPGQDYYFITALSGHHQDPQKRFSPCRELNMRVIFRVCCKAPLSGGPASTSSPLTTGGSSTSPLASLIASSNGSPTNGGGAQKGSPAKPSLVNTVRPTFKPAPQSDLFATQAQQSQPVTVLPIEVIQPGDNSPSSDQMQPQQQQQNHNVFDGIMNEQPIKQPASASETYNFAQPTQRRPHSQPQFLPFDPTAAPDLLPGIMMKWSPTPLPPRIRTPWPSQAPAHSQANHLRPSSLLHQNHHQQHSLAQPPPPPPPPPQLPMKPWSESQAGSRLQLYPWSPSVQDVNVQPSPQLITVPPDHNTGQQGSNPTGAPTYAVALLVPLLGLAILLALGLERRLR